MMDLIPLMNTHRLIGGQAESAERSFFGLVLIGSGIPIHFSLKRLGLLAELSAIDKYRS